MKKRLFTFMALVLATSLPGVQLYAQESNLDSAIDTLQYRLTVEWNQKDLKARERIIADFTRDLSELQREGVTDAKIFSSLNARAFDAQTAKDVETLAEYAKTKGFTASETRQLVLDYANQSQRLGTSWASEATVGVAIGAILVLVLIAVLTHSLGSPTSGTDGGGTSIHCYDSYCAAPPVGAEAGYQCPTYCY